MKHRFTIPELDKTFYHSGVPFSKPRSSSRGDEAQISRISEPLYVGCYSFERTSGLWQICLGGGVVPNGSKTEALPIVDGQADLLDATAPAIIPQQPPAMV